MKRVLVCALDWGLGHATRCVPLVRELQRQGAEVILASSGYAGQLLRLEFPGLSYHELPGYRPEYSAKGSMIRSLAGQAMRFRQAIRLEHAELEALVKYQKIQTVISDNRYGCYSREVPSIMITHQPVVRLSPGNGFVEWFVNRWLRPYLDKYKEIWIPDQPGSGLTNRFMPREGRIRHIGWLSRFPIGALPAEPLSIMAIVSGPEPHRSLLVQKMRSQLSIRADRTLLVTGEPEKKRTERSGNLEIVSHLATPQMEAQLLAANLVISRSGYSTIMDLAALGKRAAFIPTPRQPEQEFFAQHLKHSGIAFYEEQENFTVDRLVEESSRYSGFGVFRKEPGLLAPAIKQIML